MPGNALKEQFNFFRMQNLSDLSCNRWSCGNSVFNYMMEQESGAKRDDKTVVEATRLAVLAAFFNVAGLHTGSAKKWLFKERFIFVTGRDHR